MGKIKETIKGKIKGLSDNAKSFRLAEMEPKKEPRRVQRFGHRETRGHAKNGQTACAIGAIDIFVLFVLLMISLATRGKAAMVIGVIGLLCWMVSFFGLSHALRGFRERDKNYITCKVGLGVNLGIILFLFLLFIWGLF